ncbi:MAG: twin-arginine translocase TatA/TatE family subunit [Desulfotomaculaceae bacterium]|nr:twin-arginine translocase TatA/TatE family subunit [Desulfotomaculaceae bacterium]
MFPNLGMSELILILVIALVVFGPRKLPEVGKSFGRTLNEFRKASLSNISEVSSATKDVKEEIQKVTEVVQNKS